MSYAFTYSVRKSCQLDGLEKAVKGKRKDEAFAKYKAAATALGNYLERAELEPLESSEY
jgi:hypothetical protein